MGNVRAEVRIRPGRNSVLEYEGRSIAVAGKVYRFSRIHSGVSQRGFFSVSVAPLLERFLAGTDCSVLAYGQTGSGKTYTMGLASGARDAIIQRALEYLYGRGLRLVISFYEVYNDDVYDLLGESRTPLPVRQREEQLGIVGLTEHTPETVEQALGLLRHGCMARTTSATRMNKESSRSHAIFNVVLRQCVGGDVSTDADAAGGVSVATFSFVDLAGSERLKRSGCRGAGRQESISINSGLLALGNVISALYMRKSHVPFRDSKLTRLLENSLRSDLLLIACVSPESGDAGETMNTLKYASRAAHISLETRVHIETDRDKLVIAELRKEISRLRSENQRLRRESAREGCSPTGAVSQWVCAECRGRIGDGENGDQNRQGNLVRKSINVIGAEQATARTGSGTARRGVLFAGQCSVDGNIQATIHTGNIQARGLASARRGAAKAASVDYVPGSAATVENTLYNKGLRQAAAHTAAAHTADRQDKRVSFNLESRSRFSLFTPKKERPCVSIVSVCAIPCSAVSMVCSAGSQVLFNSADSRVYSIDSEKQREALLLHDESIRCIEGDSTDLTYSSGALLKHYSGKDCLRPQTVFAYPSEISALKRRGDYVYSGHEDGSVSVLDVRMGRVVFSENVHRSTVYDIEETEQLLYSCSRDHSIRYLIKRDGVIDQTMTSSKDDVICDGTGVDRVVDSSPLYTLSPPHYDTVSRLLVYKGFLISLGRDCALKTWKGSQPFKTVPYAHDAWIRAGAVLRDCWLTGCKAGQIRAWDFMDESVRCIGKQSYDGPINCMASYDSLYAAHSSHSSRPSHSSHSSQFWVGSSKEIRLYRIDR